MRALLVVNPKATGASAQVRDVLAHALASEIKLDVAETTARGHATELADQAAVDGLDVVVALGGDGTVNEVVNGLLTNGPGAELPALAVVPAGGTNVFARALGMPNSPIEATSQLLHALRSDRRRTIGLGRADARWFTFCAGLGIDAGAVRRMEHHRARGRRSAPARYVRSAVREFYLGTSRRQPVITLSRDGEDPVELGLALVCSTTPWTYLGDRAVRACPDASFDLGLDVFGLRRLGTATTLRNLRQMLIADGRPRGRQLLAVHDAATLTLSSALPLPFQVDGDDLGDRTHVELTAVPAALSVLV
jgi:diacylglycerol kinase family enzyme